MSRHTPVFVTLRVARGLPNLRSSRCFGAIHRSLSGGCDRLGMRLVHYSVQSNHLHLLVEAASSEALARGLQGLSVRIARRLNRALQRRGTVFSDRYHSRVLRSPIAVRHALVYLLNNARKHAAQGGAKKPAGWIDSRSSAYVFDGWRASELDFDYVEDPATVSPRSWLLSRGWRARGLLSPNEVPSEKARARPKGARAHQRAPPLLRTRG